MATIKEQLDGHTSDIIEATELLKVLGDRAGRYVWKQLTAEGGDFVAFVTADDEGSYPNKGTQDGYYYVKFDPLTAIAENIREGVDIFGIIGAMKEGFDLSVLGCTEYAVDTFSYSSMVNPSPTNPLNHSLGEVPKLAIILASSEPTAKNGASNIAVEIVATIGSRTYWASVGWNQYRNNVDGYYGKLATMTKTKLYPHTSLTGCYQPNLLYKLITFA